MDWECMKRGVEFASCVLHGKSAWVGIRLIDTDTVIDRLATMASQRTTLYFPLRETVRELTESTED